MPKPETHANLPKTNLKVLARARTRFNDIFVIEDGIKREMWFNGSGKFFLQSRVDTRKPKTPSLIYSKMILAALLIQPNPQRILIIGLGGGALSNCLAAWYPACRIDVVEIDPKVIALAKKYFQVEEGPNYKIHEADGRLFLQNQIKRGEAYDIIFLDAFKSGSIPFHLKTFEFYRDLKLALTNGGVVASNLYGKSNNMKPHDRQTFLKVFPEIFVFEDEKRVATVSIATQEVLGWGLDQFEIRAKAFEPPPGMDVSMQEVVGNFRHNAFADEKAKVLRDDFAPDEIQTAIEQNNRQSTLTRQYPISNVS
ncbi:MAG: hypothetical protein G3M70_08865 [Candidatus Nitronauta litoralis]|uniref:PABS domain-containing protein n=1 Tax=Candidatus Nitronauta litoralis TaxID=2705533 RepID=A0A7T0BVW8_9BACT|nr:MAG: hypothetical protein G3M70_08865 [Candidatus Nitronauta litoralis]